MKTPESIESARIMLQLAGIFYTTPAELEEMRQSGEWTEADLKEFESELQTLNMNDVWAWALGYGVKVTDEELPELARLYRAYGYCGILYWVAEKDGWERSAFEDITRYVQFVREEERILKEVPESNARAYAKRGYVLGVLPPKRGMWTRIKGWFNS